MNEPRSSANAAVLLLVTGGVVAACGSTSNNDLFNSDVDPAGRSGSGGTAAGQAGVFGNAGASGAAGLGAGGSAAAGGSDRGGTGGVGGSGTGGRGGAGAGGNAGAGGSAGSSGATGGVAGTSGPDGSGGGATGGNQGTSGAGGTQGVGGGDAGSTGGAGGIAGSSGTQGTGGSSTGGTSGGNGTGGSGGTTDPPPCVTKASQTVLIGDSFVNWITHSFRADLARITGESWRLYAAGGSAMASGGIGTMIPQQFENALRADPDISVVVMDGGGNDILLPASSWGGGGECNDRMDSPSLPVCRQIVQASLEKELVLMDRMADAGVRDVVFFFYPIVPNGTTLGGRYPNAISGWARPQVKEQCDGTYQRTGGRLRCHFVDLVPVFQNHSDYFATGDIHPNTSGSAAMARAVWQTMSSACIAQKPSSGCCKP